MVLPHLQAISRVAIKYILLIDSARVSPTFISRNSTLPAVTANMINHVSAIDDEDNTVQIVICCILKLGFCPNNKNTNVRTQPDYSDETTSNKSSDDINNNCCDINTTNSSMNTIMNTIDSCIHLAIIVGIVHESSHINNLLNPNFCIIMSIICIYCIKIIDCSQTIKIIFQIKVYSFVYIVISIMANKACINVESGLSRNYIHCDCTIMAILSDLMAAFGAKNINELDRTILAGSDWIHTYFVILLEYYDFIHIKESNHSCMMITRQFLNSVNKNVVSGSLTDIVKQKS